MKYRSEVDGLRAIAVTSVMLYHAKTPLVTGGFVGVDIFFVISGFLITTLISREMETGTFTIVNFYERRIRRILPALFLVLFACIPFALLWMLPGELEFFSKTAIAVVLFVSNVVLWLNSGYFSPLAELSPLLHTWSLAVEEQFYVVFPIFIMLFWRLGRRIVVGVIMLALVASLAIAEVGSREFISANFYLIPSRAWELSIGALVAFYLNNGAARPNNILALLGLAGIVFGIFAYLPTTPFPSLIALPPVVGAAMVIAFAGRDTWVGRLLRLPPMVWMASKPIWCRSRSAGVAISPSSLEVSSA